MFPCFFFFKNCISLLAQFQDVFFHNVFSSIGFSMSIFQGLYFAIFSCARLQVFSNMFFPVRYIFSRAVFYQLFPAPCFFQNVFSRIAFCRFFPAHFFPGCFFQNCILFIFSCILCLSVFFQNVFSQNCILPIFSCTAWFQAFSIMLFQRYCFFPEDFFSNVGSCCFSSAATFFSPTLVNISMNSLCVQMFLSCFFRNMDFACLFFPARFFFHSSCPNAVFPLHSPIRFFRRSFCIKLTGQLA